MKWTEAYAIRGENEKYLENLKEKRVVERRE
jgi:hypothetical protein